MSWRADFTIDFISHNQGKQAEVDVEQSSCPLVTPEQSISTITP